MLLGYVVAAGHYGIGPEQDAVVGWRLLRSFPQSTEKCCRTLERAVALDQHWLDFCNKGAADYCRVCAGLLDSVQIGSRTDAEAHENGSVSMFTQISNGTGELSVTAPRRGSRTSVMSDKIEVGRGVAHRLGFDLVQ